MPPKEIRGLLLLIEAVVVYFRTTLPLEARIVQVQVRLALGYCCHRLSRRARVTVTVTVSRMASPLGLMVDRLRSALKMRSARGAVKAKAR